MAELWIRIDAGIARNPKIRHAGPLPAWLHVCGIAYCREHMTDGHIQRVFLVDVAPGLPRPVKHADKLVLVGLWLKDGEAGYRIDDYLKWNPTKLEIQAQQNKWRDQKRGQRDMSAVDSHGTPQRTPNETPHGTPPSVPRVGADTPDGRAHSALALSNSALGLALETAEQKPPERAALAPVEPKWVQRHPRAGVSLLAAGAHPWCDHATVAACGRGFCVPKVVAESWRTQVGWDSIGETDIRRTVDKWAGMLPPGPIVEDPYDYWRKAWRLEHGGSDTKAPTRQTKGNANAEAAARFIAEQRARKAGS